MTRPFVILAVREGLAAVLREVTYRRLTPVPSFSEVYEVRLNTGLASPERSGDAGILAGLAGIGRVQAAVSTVYALERWRPACVVLVGSAGGFASRGVTLGDVLVATEIVDYELQRLSDDGMEVRLERFRTDVQLVDFARNLSWPRGDAAAPSQGRRVHFGSVLSGDKIVASEEAVKRLMSNDSDALGVEMEGAGVAYALRAADSSAGLLMIRGVVDLANSEKPTDSATWTGPACAAAASCAIGVLLERLKEQCAT